VTTKIKSSAPDWPVVEAACSALAAAMKSSSYEMRPVKSTPAHQTDKFAELVCSNSLKSESENTAPWLLKEEMRRVDSLLLESPRQPAFPPDTLLLSTVNIRGQSY